VFRILLLKLKIKIEKKMKLKLTKLKILKKFNYSEGTPIRPWHWACCFTTGSPDSLPPFCNPNEPDRISELHLLFF
jgi:hypothetical protein